MINWIKIKSSKKIQQNYQEYNFREHVLWANLKAATTDKTTPDTTDRKFWSEKNLKIKERIKSSLR